MYFNPHNNKANWGTFDWRSEHWRALHISIVLLQLASGVAGDAVTTFTLSSNITVPLIGLGSASGVRYQHVGS